MSNLTQSASTYSIRKGRQIGQILSKGQAEISSMGWLNFVSDLMSDLIDNTGFAVLNIHLTAPTASHLNLCHA